VSLLIVLFSFGGAKANHIRFNATDSAGNYLTRAVHYRAPAINAATLFYIQRDPNSNTILYELNTASDGELNKDNPVHVFWIKYNERGQKEELNYLQRKFAYGVNVKPVDDDRYDIRFVSYKKFPMLLMKAADGKYHIFATIDNKQAILKSIFIRIEGGSFWIPNVLYVEVNGTDPLTGKEVTGRFKP
jgi:hypothetical protein